jgi:hypothetical protein
LAGWVPEQLGNAGDWLYNAINRGWPTSDGPRINSVVVYMPGAGYSSYGHVAVVQAMYPNATFLVREMNYSAWNVYNDRVSSFYNVAGFILDPNPPPAPAPTPAPAGPFPGADRLELAYAGLADWFNRGQPDATTRLNQLAGQANAIG